MPKYVIEREIPNLGSLSDDEISAISKKSTACSPTWAATCSGSRAMSPTTSSSACTSRRMPTGCANMPPAAASPRTTWLALCARSIPPLAVCSPRSSHRFSAPWARDYRGVVGPSLAGRGPAADGSGRTRPVWRAPSATLGPPLRAERPGGEAGLVLQLSAPRIPPAQPRDVLRPVCEPREPLRLLQTAKSAWSHPSNNCGRLLSVRAAS